MLISNPLKKLVKDSCEKTLFASNVAFYETDIDFFANFKAERGRNGSKKRKTFL